MSSRSSSRDDAAPVADGAIAVELTEWDEAGDAALSAASAWVTAGAASSAAAGTIAAEPAAGNKVGAGVTVEVEAASASVEVAVTDSAITLDTGGAADVGPPVELPVSPPSSPLPVPLP